jgi:hypothetical protein
LGSFLNCKNKIKLGLVGAAEEKRDLFCNENNEKQTKLYGSGYLLMLGIRG